jgi:hypothetical protein
MSGRVDGSGGGMGGERSGVGMGGWAGGPGIRPIRGQVLHAEARRKKTILLRHGEFVVEWVVESGSR